MKKIYSAGILAGLLIAGLAGTVQATTITAHITADNHYGLYFGDATGSNLKFVGRNETGPDDALSGYNWSLPETYTFNTSVGDYLYVAVWDDGGPQMWTADFSWDNDIAPELVTDASNWQFIQGGTNLPGTSSVPVTISAMQSYIGSASWANIGASLAYNSGPWGNIAGVDDSASFIWGTLTDGPDAYQIFRTKNPVPAPEPATMLLFGTGLAGLIGILRKKKG
jgi:hypothetical protein